MNCSTSLPAKRRHVGAVERVVVRRAEQALDVRADVVAVDHERAVERAAVVGDAVLGDDHARGRGAVAGGVVAGAAAEVGAGRGQAGLAVVEVLVVAGPGVDDGGEALLAGVEVVAVAERDVDARDAGRADDFEADDRAAAAARRQLRAEVAQLDARDALRRDVEVVVLAGRGADGDGAVGLQLDGGGLRGRGQAECGGGGYDRRRQETMGHGRSLVGRRRQLRRRRPATVPRLVPVTSSASACAARRGSRGRSGAPRRPTRRPARRRSSPAPGA